MMTRCNDTNFSYFTVNRRKEHHNRALPAVCSRTRLLEHVRLGLAGTRLRAGSARDFMGPLGPRSATDLEGLYQGLTGASRGPVLGGPGRLTCYAIGTTASTADSRGILHRPILRRPPEQGHPPLDPPGAATLRDAGPGSGSVGWRTWKRTTAGGPGRATDT